MIFGKYGEGKEAMPRVLYVNISRYSKTLPVKGELLKFIVSLHEEGTGISWQQNITVTPETERLFLEKTHELYLWSLNAALTPAKASEDIALLGKELYRTFIGLRGDKILSSIPSTALLLNIDETIINLPWELMGKRGEPLALGTPFGRLVTTRTLPRPARDPLKEDHVVRILAVANPTKDLLAGELEIKVLRELEGYHGCYSIQVQLLERENATKGAFADIIATGDFDIIHFSGHGFFDPTQPGMSAIRFADGLLTASEVLRLKWKSPPYLVFNSACESGKATGGRRLISGKSNSNGLAAAFIAAGVSAYAGYYWPVTETGAGLFTGFFYRTLFERENVGIAFQESRKFVKRELKDVGDLTGYSAVLYGDAASEHRRDLAMAK